MKNSFVITVLISLCLSFMTLGLIGCGDGSGGNESGTNITIPNGIPTVTNADSNFSEPIISLTAIPTDTELSVPEEQNNLDKAFAAMSRIEAINNGLAKYGAAYTWATFDCSFFISIVCFKLPRLTTDNMSLYFSEIPKESLRAADILNMTVNSDPAKKGHVRLFLYWKDNDPNTGTIITLENSGDTGVRINERAYSSLYKPMRYNGITSIPVGAGAKFQNRFIDCFHRKGDYRNVGEPISGTKWYENYVIQEFAWTAAGKSYIIQNERAGNVPAVWTHGEIANKIFSIGLNKLGSPIQDEATGIKSSKTGAENVYQKCQNGTVVYHTTKTYQGKTFAIWGKIYQKWYDLGTGNSKLGLPISDVQSSGNKTFATFEGGELFFIGNGNVNVR